MPIDGALLNAGATAIAAASFLFAARELWIRRAVAKTTTASAMFFATVGTFLLLAAARQLAGLSGNHDVDRALFMLLLAPAGLAIVPLVYMGVGALTGDVRRARMIAAFFVGVNLVGLGFAYAGGVSGPMFTEWGTEYALNSSVAKIMLIVFLTLPGVAIGAALAWTGRRTAGEDGRRATLVGASCAIYYVVFTIDALALEGWGLIAARVVTAGAALLAYVAYLPRPTASALPAARQEA